MSVGVALIIIAAILIVEALVGILNFVRIQLKGAEISKGEIGVTATRVLVGKNCTATFSWAVRNLKITTPDMVNITTRLMIDGHQTVEEKKQYTAYAAWSGWLSNTVSWPTTGKKNISAEIIVGLPDGSSISASADGDVEVVATEGP
jgi:hypothetical protein